MLIVVDMFSFMFLDTIRPDTDLIGLDLIDCLGLLVYYGLFYMFVLVCGVPRFVA